MDKSFMIKTATIKLSILFHSIHDFNRVILEFFFLDKNNFMSCSTA